MSRNLESALDREPVLDDLFAPNVSRLVAGRPGRRLLSGQDPPLLAYLRHLVKAGDADRLTQLCYGTVAGHKMLSVAGYDASVGDGLGAPFEPGERPVVSATRAAAALGLVLVAGEANAKGHLEVFRRWCSRSGLVPAGAPVTRVPDEVVTPHAAILRTLATAGQLDLVSLCWLLQLDGWFRPEADVTSRRLADRIRRWSDDRRRRARRGPSVQVVFDRGSEGQRATLSLAWLPRFSRGLVPDPALMMLSAADARFLSSLNNAWNASGGTRRGALLWSLVAEDGPIGWVTDESLGLAFTLLVNEHRRLTRRPFGKLTVSRLKPRVTVIGRIDPDAPAKASPVSGYRAKLTVIEPESPVVLPADDYEKARDANRLRGNNAELRPATTWRRAARASRKLEPWRVLALIATVLLTVAMVSGGVIAVLASHRDADQRTAVAADLAARAITLRNTDPVLAAKLGLAAHGIDPGNSRAVDALRDVLQDNRNVVRTWNAEPSLVESTAVSEVQNRVLTSGRSGTTHVWELSTGRLLGTLPRDSGHLTTAESRPYAVAETPQGTMLYDFGGEHPAEIGSFPEPTCSTETYKAITTFKFTKHDSAVTAVWDDGTIASFDVVTRQQVNCASWSDNVAPLTFPTKLPIGKVLDAVVLPADVPGAEDEVLFLLTNNTVITTVVGARQARVEVPAEKLSGDATRLAASDAVVAVGTAQGVAVWNRHDHSLLVNPAGGLATKVDVLLEAHGHLLISTALGTILVPLATDAWEMANGLATPSGGSATVAAISGRAIVAGGPGGRISVLAGSSGVLALGQKQSFTATSFLPDGRLLAAVVDGPGAGTFSRGLTIVDPRQDLSTNPAVANEQERRWTYGKEQLAFFSNAVASTGALLATAGQFRGRGSILVWQIDKPDSPVELTMPQPNEDELKPDERIIASLCFTLDGRYLVARHVSGEMGVWSTADWKRQATAHLKPGNTRMVVRAGQVELLEGSDDDATLTVLELPSLGGARRVPAPGMVFLDGDSDETSLATMTLDGRVQLWDADLNPIGEPWPPPSLKDPVTDLALSHDGRQLAVAQGDQVLIYDTDKRLLTMPPLEAYGDQVINVAWALDDQLLTGGVMPPVRGNKSAGVFRVWKTGELDWTSQVCRWAGGGLTREEWQTYVRSAQPYVDLCAKAHS